MVENDPNSLTGWLISAAGAITTAGFLIRKYLKGEKVSDASDASSIKGFKGNDAVLDNLVKEVARLNLLVIELARQVEELTDDLANVRLVALDAYQVANECECSGEHKARLLEHLKLIIKGRVREIRP